jgi:hypothetical protein
MSATTTIIALACHMLFICVVGAALCALDAD